MQNKPKAIILAAGFGTRLLPLTDHTPKALIELGHKPLLQHLIEKLEHQGFATVYINVHYLSDQIIDFVENLNPLLQVYFSIEKTLLDTGGGIKRIVETNNINDPLLIHNVDVVSDLQLHRFYQHHIQSGASATLAVQKRPTRRYLLFDDKNQLCGRLKGSRKEYSRPPKGQPREFAFNGIQVAHPDLFKAVDKDIFSSIEAYLKASAARIAINAFPIPCSLYWRDIGTPKSLQKAEKEFFSRANR